MLLLHVEAPEIIIAETGKIPPVRVEALGLLDLAAVNLGGCLRVWMK